MKVIQQFKDGKYNVLVATSIGEEGLDIGDVDLIICYDTNSSPVRMLQRMGRTGRKREGRVVFLCTEGKEVRDHLKSQESYEQIQKKIAAGDEFDFDLGRSPRILSAEFQPDCVKKEIIPPNETLEDLELKLDRRKRIPKSQKGWSLPENVNSGFVRASSLGKRKRTSPSPSIESEPAFVNPDSLTSPFMTEEQEEKVRRLRVHVSPTPRRIDILDIKSHGSVPAGTLRKRLVKTRKAMKHPNYQSDNDDFDDLISTPPDLIVEEPPRQSGLAERHVNVTRSDGSTKTPVWEEVTSSPDSLPDISIEMFASKKKTESPGQKRKDKDSDEEYGLPSDFDMTPRKRIRIANLSDEE
jgi:superfamily II DNA/RNA helicase